MRHIAVVSYPVGPSPFQLFSKWLLLLITAIVQLVWWIHRPEQAWTHLSVLLLWTAPALLILRETVWPVAGSLRWTGSNWTWQTQGQILQGTVVVQLDFQSRILIEFKVPGQRSSWLWLSAAADSAAWLSLRRAIWSIRKEDGPRADAFSDPP